MLINIKNLAEKEHDFLRDELTHLKDCQIKFLTFSITATALILGLGRSSIYVSDTSKSLPGEIWLIPLLILLPAWWIFFDKAMTITRIVGYFRHLEKILLNKVVADNFLGWENALAEFRKKQSKKQSKDQSEEQSGVNIFKYHISVYWIITFFTFFFLSVFCLYMGWKSLEEKCAIIVMSVLTFISFIWNGCTLVKLIGGKNSYNANEKKWEEILKIRPL